MKAQLGPEIIGSYKRLSYTAWYAIAEFVDNSTQAYIDNQKILDEVFKNEKVKLLTVDINYGVDKEGEFISIRDNSMGMSYSDLENAVIIGKPPVKQDWRSKYGLGMKTAACWFGDYWTVTTKKYGETKEHSIVFNVQEIMNGRMDLSHKEADKSKEEHYTEIIIRKLNRRILGRTIGKIKDYLRSMYRVDIHKKLLELFWQGEKLNWSYEDIDNRLIKNVDGKLVKRDFNFIVCGKKVWGWAGVFDMGSRADAGFSLIQADRVIKGWPDSFRPTTLFGEQEGGINDLVNQRLVGEIFLENFDVSHTKDEILFSDEERQELEANLFDALADFKQKAKSHRKYASDERVGNEEDTDIALNEFEREINSKALHDFLVGYEIPPIEKIKKNNESIRDNITKRLAPNLKATINDLTVFIYLVKDMSHNDPYVIIESTLTKETIIIIINLSHPHWEQLKGSDVILNFIRHCVYDGVAEWKTYFKVGKIDPDTVKLIKDNLLRIPFEMEKNNG